MVPRSTPSLSFPAIHPEPPRIEAVSDGPCGVQINPVVGYNAVELTYYDAEHIPRIRMQLDSTVSQEMVDYFRKCAQRLGDQLPPFPTARNATLPGPRLLP